MPHSPYFKRTITGIPMGGSFLKRRPTFNSQKEPSSLEQSELQPQANYYESLGMIPSQGVLPEASSKAIVPQLTLPTVPSISKQRTVEQRRLSQVTPAAKKVASPQP